MGRAVVNRILLLLLNLKHGKPERGILWVFFQACKSILSNIVIWLAAFFSREISNKFICHLQAGISHFHH